MNAALSTAVEQAAAELRAKHPSAAILIDLDLVSYVFDVGDDTVWSPALRVRDLYVRFLTQLGDHFGLPTGLNAMASDYYYIDPATFETFVRKLFEENFRSSHQVGRAMVESVLAPSIVILDRINRPVSASTPEQREFLEKARALSMAR